MKVNLIGCTTFRPEAFVKCKYRKFKKMNEYVMILPRMRGKKNKKHGAR